MELSWRRVRRGAEARYTPRWRRRGLAPRGEGALHPSPCNGDRGSVEPNGVPSANDVVTAIEWYLRIGAGVGVVFALIVGRVEPSARGGSALFRLMILPGAAVLWPLVVVRSVRALLRRSTQDHA